MHLACRTTPYIDDIQPGLTSSALAHDAYNRDAPYRNVSIYDSRFVLPPRWRACGWRKKNSLQRLHLTLSLIATCTPSLTQSIHDDRGEDKAGKDCNCCHYNHALLQPKSYKHKVHGDATHYLDVFIGKAMGISYKEKAHRVMCYAWHGPPSSHLPVVRHLCSNIGGTCLNPYHLQWNTVKANNVDVHALIKERAQVLAARALHEGAVQIHQR